MNKISFLWLAVCLIISNVYAATYGGGTAADPYQIRTPEQMNTIGANSGDWGKCFRLMADIDMSAYTDTQYNIIGNGTIPFTGTFDGNNHVISNLTYCSIITSVNYAGLFGFTQSAVIRDLTLENLYLSIQFGVSVGGLTGYQNNGTITHCTCTGQIHTRGSSVGGLVGENSSSGSITACFWDIQTSDLAASDGGTGKTTAQMKTLSTFTSAGWNFVDMWAMGNGQTYPYLRSLTGINPADINYSGTVDMQDLAILAANWMEQ